MMGEDEAWWTGVRPGCWSAPSDSGPAVSCFMGVDKAVMLPVTDEPILVGCRRLFYLSFFVSHQARVGWMAGRQAGALPEADECSLVGCWEYFYLSIFVGQGFDGTMALAHGWVRGSRRVQTRLLLEACFMCQFSSNKVSLSFRSVEGVDDGVGSG